MPSEQHFSCIQDENKFNNIYKLYRNEGKMGQPGQCLLIVTGKVKGVGHG